MIKLILSLFIVVFGANLSFGEVAPEVQGLNVFVGGNVDEAVKVYEKDCNSNNAEACLMLGLMYAEGFEVKSDAIKSGKYYEKGIKLVKAACENKDGFACGQLGDMYQNGLGVEQNYEMAVKYFGTACSFKDEKSCKRFKRLLK